MYMPFIELRKKSFERLRLDKKRNSYKILTLKEKVIFNFPFPSLYPYLLRLFGVNVGYNVKFLGKLKIRGNFKNITISNDCIIGSNVELRTRERGIIFLSEEVYLDQNVRIIAAREGNVLVGLGTKIGANTILNSGGKTSIGKYCLLAGFVNINSSSHGISKKQWIQEQIHMHGEVVIEDDVWLGAYVSVIMNSKISQGSVVGAHSLVNSELPEFSISVGVPAKTIKFRD